MKMSVLTWDWKEQLDLDDLDRAVRHASDGIARVHQIDTGSDQFAIVVADHRVTPEQAHEVYAVYLETGRNPS